jgi:hypothetical protein
MLVVALSSAVRGRVGMQPAEVGPWNEADLRQDMIFLTSGFDYSNIISLLFLLL